MLIRAYCNTQIQQEGFDLTPNTKSLQMEMFHFEEFYLQFYNILRRKGSSNNNERYLTLKTQSIKANSSFLCFY